MSKARAEVPLITSASGQRHRQPSTLHDADSFTYYASDGVSNSAVATVALAGIATGVVFSDNFTRAINPGVLAPWVGRTGTWTVAGGMMGGFGAGSSYGAVYVTNSWGTYSIPYTFSVENMTVSQ